MGYKIKKKKTGQEAWVIWRKKGGERGREAESRRKEARAGAQSNPLLFIR